MSFDSQLTFLARQSLCIDHEAETPGKKMSVEPVDMAGTLDLGKVSNSFRYSFSIQLSVVGMSEEKNRATTKEFHEAQLKWMSIYVFRCVYRNVPVHRYARIRQGIL